MAFHVLQFRRIDLRTVGPVDGENLAFLARRPQAFAAAIRRNPHAANHRMNLVLVGERLRQRLQHDGRVTVGADQAVGIGVKRPRTGPADRLGHREQHQAVPLAVRCAADDCHIDKALPERMTPDRHGDQGRGTRGIDRQIRPLQPKRLRDQPRDLGRRQFRTAIGAPPRFFPMHAIHDAFDRRQLHVGRQRAEGGVVPEILRHLVNVDRRRQFARQATAARMTDVNSHVALREVERIITCVPASHCRDFAQDEMRGIGVVDHLLRQRANVFVQRPLRHDAANLRIRPAHFPLFGIEIQGAIQPLSRQLGDAAASVAYQPPVIVQIIGAGQPASQPDDRQRNIVELWLHLPAPSGLSLIHHAPAGAVTAIHGVLLDSGRSLTISLSTSTYRNKRSGPFEKGGKFATLVMNATRVVPSRTTGAVVSRGETKGQVSVHERKAASRNLETEVQLPWQAKGVRTVTIAGFPQQSVL